MLESGKQLNGLPTKYREIDSKPMHNFGDSSTWMDYDGNLTPADSTFMMKPPVDEAWALQAVRIRFSANADFTNRPLTIKYYIHGVPTPVRQTVYANSDDFLDRCNKFELLEVAGNGKYDNNIFAFTYNFPEKLILWGTAPGEVDPANDPRMSHFTMEVAGHLPIKGEDDLDLEVVKVRYTDVEVYDI